MKHMIFGAALFVSTVVVASASDVQKFVKDTHDEFAKGEARGVSITEKGELRLAPAVKKVCDLPQPIIWSAGRDSKGHLYLGGGEGKVWRVGADGKPSVFFTAKEQQIHALAVDEKDNVYAASSPDGKIYRIKPDGASSVFYDPPDKYIWALAFDRHGNLFVACGSKAAIYKVSPAGTAEAYFASDETNIISLGFDKDGRLLAGSEPGAYLYRCDGPGKAFVVYDSPLKELKAIATDAEGNVRALAVGDGEKPMAAGSAPATAAMTAPNIKVEDKKPGRTSELYRIHADGYVETLWASKEACGFSLTGGGDGATWIGTGDKGVIYAVRGRDESSTLAKLNGQQVTSLLPAGRGEWIAVTSNLGAVWSIGSSRATEGTWESEAMDARVFSTWGIVHIDGCMDSGGKITLSSRSGNTDKPEKTWSDWADAERRGDGFSLKSPPARYLQVRVKLGGTATAHAPVVDRLTVYYAPRNLPPQFTRLTIFEPGYGSQKMQQPEQAVQASVDTLIQTAGRRDPMDVTRKQRVQIQSQPGLRMATWAVTDPNLDPMTFNVYLRAEGETAWKLLAEKSGDFYVSFDSRSFPDGRYRLKVVATDAPGNPTGKGLSASIESSAFTIDNTPPVITVRSAQVVGGDLIVKFTVSDALTPIGLVEVSTDGREWFPVLPPAAEAGARDQEFTVRLPSAKSAYLRARDELGNTAAARAAGK